MPEMYPRFTVAAVQAAPVFFDREKTIKKALGLIEEAADKGARIIGFPEVFIPGHTELWYAVKNTNPLHTQGTLFKQLVNNAVTVPSQATERLCAAARKAHAYLVMGICEADPLYSGTVYMSQLFISDKGEILGVHRKLMTTMIEKLIFSTGDGSYLNVYDTPYGKLSALNCGEHSHSLVKYALLAMGAQIHVASWPSFPANLFHKGQLDSIDFRVRSFAHEGKLFIINACAITDKQNIDFCAGTKEERDKIVVDSGGSSSIIGPNGEYRAGPKYGGEGIVTAEISLEDSIAGKQVHNVLGHYTRWDVLSLNFNRERLSPFKDTSEKPPPL